MEWGQEIMTEYARLPICLLFCVLSFSLIASHAQQTDSTTLPKECSRSLWEAPASSQPPQQVWDGDTANLVGYRSIGTDKLESQYITADILRISRDEFPSESRTVVQSQSGVRSITFDAREIIIDMPLVFTSASVRFLADTVRFTQRGSITFTGAPSQDNDGITIIAETVDTSNALHHPLQFVTQDANWTPNAKRTVSITGRSITPAVSATQLKKWARGLTLDDNYADVATGADPYSGYSLSSGPAAQTLYSKTLDAEMLWPQQLADKVAREFAEAPFDEARDAFLRAKTVSYLRLLRNTHHELARSVLTSTMTAIDLNVDELGFHRYFIPRTGFPDYEKSFKQLAEEQLNAMVKWNSAILAAHSGRKFDAQQFADLDSQLQSANRDLDAASDTVTTQLGNLSKHEENIAVLLQTIDQERALIQHTRDDDKEKAETNSNIGVATKVLVMAASFLPVSAPVAIAIGVAVDATGKAVLAHNQGQTVTGLSVAKTLPAAIQEAKTFKSLADTVSQNWNAVEKNTKTLQEKQNGISKAVGDDAKEKATTARNDAAEKTADAIGKFGTSISDLFAKVQPPEPTQLSMDSYEQKDSTLQDLLKQVGDIRNAEAETLASLDAARKEVVLKTGTRDKLRTDTEAARASSLQNDREVSRLEELAWTIRQSFLRDLAYNVAVLLRAYRYHTGLNVEGPINATYFSTYYRLSRPNRSPEENREGDQFFYGGTAEELGQQLKAQDDQLKNEVIALETQVDEGYNKYFNLISQHNFLTEDKVLSCSDDAVSKDRCDFIDAVNKELARQISNVAAGRTDVRPTPIPVPFSIQEAFTGLPEKLLDAGVRVTVEDGDTLKGKSIQYSLVHPFIGALHLSQECFSVDMRRTDAIENVQRYTSSCNENSECTHTPVMLKEDYVKENAALAALPLDAKYYFEVRVRDAANSSQLPKLTEVKIHLSYVQ